ncbi:MAG: HAMP domain-containing histidine kinase [Cyclobacteriaceae bacterium]|nr:HAMP domain-containing histidine kinase [Cyclobacteriaceae bacterium]
MNISFKNRIALNYMVATAIMIAVVFIIILVIVKTTVIYNLDKNLTFEAKKHRGELIIHNDSVHFVNILEWTEREHREVEFNPVFIQIVNLEGLLMDKSPNLKEDSLLFRAGSGNPKSSIIIKGGALRQIQIPIKEHDEVIGYMLAAVSMEEAKMVMKNLQNVLLILYPVVLIALFGVARYLAGRSIKPIQKITNTANHITRNNLNERIELPKNKDELYTLTASINELLQRMQDALEREKQFTSDASHELRTPLSVLIGTLEVLIRKPRTEAEYKEKITYSIAEINRMSETVDQLLMLARTDNPSRLVETHQIEPIAIIDAVLIRHKEQIKHHSLKIDVMAADEIQLISNPYYLDLIFDNLLSNAIKYSHQNGSIQISFSKSVAGIKCTIADQGIGIANEDISQIYNPFFRSNPLTNKRVKGNGLGLSIVKKACDSLGVHIKIDSKIEEGTQISLLFPLLINP